MTMNKIPARTGLRARWIVDPADPAGRRMITVWSRTAPVEFLVTTMLTLVAALIPLAYIKRKGWLQ